MYGAERAKTLPLPANSSKMRAVTETYRVIAAERNPQALQQAAHKLNQLNQLSQGIHSCANVKQKAWARVSSVSHVLWKFCKATWRASFL